MAYLFRMLFPFSWMLLLETSAAAQNIPESESRKSCLPFGMDSCTDWQLRLTHVACFGKSSVQVNISKEVTGYLLRVQYVPDSMFIPANVEGKDPSFSVRISEEMFERFRAFEKGLGSGHAHVDDCRGTTYLIIRSGGNTGSYMHCGCGPDAAAGLAEILAACKTGQTRESFPVRQRIQTVNIN